MKNLRRAMRKQGGKTNYLLPLLAQVTPSGSIDHAKTENKTWEDSGHSGPSLSYAEVVVCATDINGDAISVRNCMHPDTDPSATDDLSEGFNYGSWWYNADNGKLFFCVNPSNDYAVWVQIN